MQTLPFNTVRDIFTLSYSIIISKPYSNFNDSEPFLKHFVALKNAAFDPTNQNPNIYRETISKKRRFYCVYTLFQALIYYYSVSHGVNVDNKIRKIKKISLSRQVSIAGMITKPAPFGKPGSR